MTAQKGRKTGRGGSGEDALRQQLESQLSALAGLGPRAEPAEITDAVESVMATVEGDLSAVNLKLYAEIEALSRFIAAAKAEIASVRPDEINTEHLPTATDELEAIVGATESATNTILEAMETLEPIGDELGGETGQKIADSVTQVYEACNFQDITGQRITKVVTALKQVEDKVDTLLAAFGEDAAAARRERTAAPKKQANADDDASLMNGPSAPGDGAVSQDDIDALLASFD
jgi:chemotaxis protein CheZ